MKLYTEEQVRLLLSEHLSEYSVDKCLRNTEHIELPSDEEIWEKIEDSTYSLEYDTGFAQGVKWVIEQIKQQDK
jgi:hypothetical protein